MHFPASGTEPTTLPKLSMAKTSVLLIDDQPLVLTALARYLEQKGFRVYARSNGKEGLDAAEELEPDVIITDVMMPVMDGWEVVKQLRSKPRFALTPVIILTDLDSAEHRIQGFTTGADDYVSKNTIVEELEARITRAVNRSGLLRKGILASTESKLPRRALGAGPFAPTEKPGSKPQPTVADSWSLPAFDENFPPGGRRSSRRAAAADSGSGMRGSVNQIGLASIISLLSNGGKTGILALSRADSGAQGQIFFREGTVLKVQIGNREGLDSMKSFCLMLAWRDATFVFNSEEVTLADELNIPTEHLLMEAARLTDEGPK